MSFGVPFRQTHMKQGHCINGSTNPNQTVYPMTWPTKYVLPYESLSQGSQLVEFWQQVLFSAISVSQPLLNLWLRGRGRLTGSLTWHPKKSVAALCQSYPSSWFTALLFKHGHFGNVCWITRGTSPPGWVEEQHAGWQRLMQQQRSLDEDQRTLGNKSPAQMAKWDGVLDYLGWLL